MRSHTVTVTPKGKKPRRAKQSKVRTRELKLTVSLYAYEAMTARVGEVGRKMKEIREVGKVWVESRLDGRVYESVKLYGGVACLDEKASWTRFVCLGYSKAGAKGEDYRVEGMGDGEGWEMWFKGEVWEIHLGVVLERHFGGQEVELGDQVGDHEDAFELLPDLPDLSTISSKEGKQGGGKTDPPPYTPDKSATKATLLAEMKNMTDIITSAQKTPMSIIENMIKMQTAQAEAMVARLAAQADGANPMYTIAQMEAMKGMFK
jgi:hypothetical protein